MASKISLTEYLKRRKQISEHWSKDEGAYRELSSSEEDESEDEDSFREAAKVTDTRQNRSIEENAEIDSNQEDSRARKKTKLD